MPAGNRVETSVSLRTTGIWANTIGHDPYAGVAEKAKSAPAENVFEKSKAVFAAARLAGGVEVDEDRGAWKGLGRLKGGFAVPSYAPVGEAEPKPAKLPVVDDDEEDSDSESEERRRRRAARKAKKQAKREAKRRLSDSDSDSGERRRRRKEAKERRGKGDRR